MTTLDTQAIEKRLAALETQNRWLKGTGLVALALVAVAFLMGANEPNKIIEAEKFIVKDANGKNRVELGTTDDGKSWGFTISDENGKPRTSLTMKPDGTSALSFADKDGTERAAILTGADGTPALWFNDAEGRIRTLLTCSPSEHSVVLIHEDGSEGAALRLSQSGNPALNLRLTGQKDWAATLHVAPKGADLTFFDQTTEQKRLTLTSNSTNSMLILGGQTGKPTASLAAIKGNPALTLSDENGAKRAIMTATTDEGAALWFFDPKGNRQASLGYCGQEGERRMGLTLSDDADTRSAFLGLNPDKTPTIALSEANGTSALFALRSESHPDGPVISITGPEQKATATITVTKSGAGLNLTDANGQTVFQKP